MASLRLMLSTIPTISFSWLKICSSHNNAFKYKHSSRPSTRAIDSAANVERHICLILFVFNEMRQHLLPAPMRNIRYPNVLLVPSGRLANEAWEKRTSFHWLNWPRAGFKFTTYCLLLFTDFPHWNRSSLVACLNLQLCSTTSYERSGLVPHTNQFIVPTSERKSVYSSGDRSTCFWRATCGIAILSV